VEHFKELMTTVRPPAFETDSIEKVRTLDDVIEAAESVFDDFAAGRIDATLVRRRFANLSTMAHLMADASTRPDDREALRRFEIVRWLRLRKLRASNDREDSAGVVLPACGTPVLGVEPGPVTPQAVGGSTP
jgi:hypothetical protein